jgi:hypothetical protein
MVEAEDTAPLVHHVVPPQATDPAINRALEPHLVWLDADQHRHSKGLLWVFLPAGAPGLHQSLTMEAARLGYHAISLTYLSAVSPGFTCNHLPVPDVEARMRCYLAIRLQTLDGIKRSEFTDVDPPNGVYNRLTKLLQHMAARFPHEGWAQFLDDEDQPRWSRIAVAGFSQGGGNAALIGTLHRVARVVTFAAPGDGMGGVAARWIAIGKTPAERYYGLAHLRDFSFRQVRAAWTALDLDQFGAPVMQETSRPPYGDTHMLVTDLTPIRNNNFHGSVARDDFTPRLADGTPVLRDAWRYLMGGELENVEQ